MTHILALAMQKGGVGKTTTCLNLGINLAALGAKVLLIDIDPQANLTTGLGIDSHQLDYSIYEVLLNPTQGSSFATVTTDYGIDLIPSTLALAGAELELSGKVGREMLLKKALKQDQARYDYILIDPPPSLGLFTLNSLVAATSVIVPLQLHVYALKAMPQLEATIELAQDLNPGLSVGGIVPTFSDKRTSLSGAVDRQIRELYGDLVFNTSVPLNVKLAESPAAGEPISRYAPGSAGDKAYAALAEEVKARYA
jgi:chromosome partitioning protein